MLFRPDYYIYQKSCLSLAEKKLRGDFSRRQLHRKHVFGEQLINTSFLFSKIVRLFLNFESDFSPFSDYDSVIGLDEIVLNDELTVVGPEPATPLECAPPVGSETSVTCHTPPNNTSYCGWNFKTTIGAEIQVGQRGPMGGPSGGAYIYVTPTTGFVASEAVIQSPLLSDNRESGSLYFMYLLRGSQSRLTLTLSPGGEVWQASGSDAVTWWVPGVVEIPTGDEPVQVRPPKLFEMNLCCNCGMAL